MRFRPELILGVVLLLVLGLGAAVLGGRDRKTTDADPRRSSFLPSPGGTRALAEVLARRGLAVDHWRSRTALLRATVDSAPALLLVLDPTRPIASWEGEELAAYVRNGGHLLLAGAPANGAMQCFGYEVGALVSATAPARPVRVVGPPWSRSPTTRARLFETGEATVVDSVPLSDGVTSRCEVVPALTVDTLLTVDGEPALIRLQTASATVYLAADGGFFSNRTLRETDVAHIVVPLLESYSRVTFDEFHHGFDSRGSLAGTMFAWLGRTPWGLAVTQLSIVGLLALLAAAIRFGRARHVIERQRRSPREHVEALATALAAARGQDVAVRLTVQGLRRRLSRTGEPLRSDVEPWLDRMVTNVRTPRSSQALSKLQQLIRGPLPSDAVMQAANAVEDVWEDLRP